MVHPATLFSALSLVGVASAHIAAWHKGMYCLNGNSASTDLNSYSVVSPLWQQKFGGWWMHGFNDCNKYPPAAGDFVELPAGGSFQIELASNRAKTSLSYGGRDTSDWPDGQTYPEDYNVPSCITTPNLHTQNQSQAAGTAFAISYQSDINQVNPENLVVFTIRYHTPWKRVVHYDVPAAMPACPPEGCICAWGWVPNGCGEPNIYQQAFKCRVNGATSTTPLAKPNPPVWCEGNPDACTKGAKQMIYWHQQEGNNIEVSGYDLAGEFKSPAYNSKLGFNDGAQNDIFASSGSVPQSTAVNTAVTNAPSPSASSVANSGSSASTAAVAPTTAPAASTPSANAPAANTPSIDTPAASTPSANAPAVNTPSVDTPAVNTPSVDTPAANTPVAETFSVDTPSASSPAAPATPTAAATASTPSVDTPSADTPSASSPAAAVTPTAAAADNTPSVDTPSADTPSASSFAAATTTTADATAPATTTTPSRQGTGKKCKSTHRRRKFDTNVLRRSTLHGGVLAHKRRDLRRRL